MILQRFLFSDAILYPIFAIGMAIAVLLIIPKHLYKKYLLYGLILGGVGEIISGTTATFLGLIRFKSLFPFSIFNIFTIWTPITWMFAFTIFLYLLPVRKAYLIPYIIGWASLNYAVGLVLSQFGLFEYRAIGKFIAPLWFAAWYILAAWIYRRTELRINV